MNQPVRTALVFALAVFFFAPLFAGAETNSYIDLKSKPVWSFDADQRRTIVLVKNTETIKGKSYYRVEWHYGQIRPDPFYTEYWFAKGDSVFCAGVNAFGGVTMYPRPSLVIANATKPGDSWSAVIGAWAFCDTMRFQAVRIDTLELPSGNREALLITKTSKGAVQHRWFAKGDGLVRETREEKGASAVQLK